ncbi:MAG TPA: FAD:protein FMN transferase, partial [Acholeplasma sp.]|nr:FAD:protein FMN transferase [Acholeplasma sp.]
NFKDDDSDGVNDYESNPFFGLVSLYDVNEYAYNAPVVVSRKLFDVLLDAKKLYEDTDGFFNAAIGNAVDIIKKRITTHMFGSIDDAEFDLMLGELSAIKNTVNYEDVVLDEDNLTVSFKSEGIKLDLGALAKGYATQKAVDYLAFKGIKKYNIDAGSSNIALGTHPDDRNWNIGLRNPENPFLGIYGILSNVNKAIVTSGNFEQYFKHDGIRYHHIISPFDFMPKQIYHAVTLIGDDSGYLDGLSTALFSMPYEDAKALVEELNLEAVFYMYDGSVETILKDTTFKLMLDDKPTAEPNDVMIVAYILGGVIIIGGVVIVLLSIRDKKKQGDLNEDQK